MADLWLNISIAHDCVQQIYNKKPSRALNFLPLRVPRPPHRLGGPSSASGIGRTTVATPFSLYVRVEHLFNLRQCGVKVNIDSTFPVFLRGQAAGDMNENRISVRLPFFLEVFIC